MEDQQQYNYRDTNGRAELYCESVKLSDLVEAYGTPLYVYSKKRLLDNLHAFTSTLKRAGSGHYVSYAAKANSNVELMRLLAQEDAGVDVVSAGELLIALAAGFPPQKITFDGVGKTDALDAHRMAMAVLPIPVEQLRRPGLNEGIRQGLRILVTARESMAKDRTRSINALNALVRSNALGIDARRKLTPVQIEEISRWREREEKLALSIARAEAVRLAKHILDLGEQLKSNEQKLDELAEVSDAAPLLKEKGFRAVTAAKCLVAWSQEGRVRSEAAFASLAGVNPIPASSGNTVRHRLNRGGDRRLNSALHMAAITRMTHDAETCDYVEKRRAEGKTD